MNPFALDGKAMEAGVIGKTVLSSVVCVCVCGCLLTFCCCSGTFALLGSAVQKSVVIRRYVIIDVLVWVMQELVVGVGGLILFLS